MAVYRDGVRVGNFDIRVGVEKARMQAMIKALTGIGPDKPKIPDNKGQLDAIRAIVARSEGFLKPNQFSIIFNRPNGIKYEAPPPPPAATPTKVRGVERKSVTMNKSWDKDFGTSWANLKQGAGDAYGPQDSNINKIGIMCSKVNIPEKNIQFGLYRHYGATFPFPQKMQYGTLTTTFYCDGVMEVKNFFDQWQNLIWNPMTGNFNYYNEYTSSFDVFSLHNIGKKIISTGDGKAKDSKYSWVNELQNTVRQASAKVDEFLGGPAEQRLTGQFDPHRRIQLENRPVRNYGVRIHGCFPAVVSQIDFSHDATDQIGTFDVTWAYSKWIGYGFSGMTRQGEINLSVGEIRMEKDGIPFVEDLPLGLDGVVGGAIDQGITTAPIGSITGGNVMF